MAPLTSALLALVISCLAAVIAVATQRLHGPFTLDEMTGAQKLHDRPTLRIGGIAVALGAIGGGLALRDEAAGLFLALALAALPAFALGLTEDLTKRVGVRWRMAGTLMSGLVFPALSGALISHVDIPGADWLLSFTPFAMAFTAFAIGGIANATNIIDGVNGLASGSSVIVLGGFALVAGLTGDTAVLQVCLVFAAALVGFMVLNFPFGRLFLGDGGAYVAGCATAMIAVALPARNPELSPLIGLLALAHPVMETLISIQRRMARDTSPGQADRMHLHSLVYRSRARRVARVLRMDNLRSAVTALMLWPLSLMSVALMVMGRHSSPAILSGLVLVSLVYIILYRRMAHLRPSDLREARA